MFRYSKIILLANSLFITNVALCSAESRIVYEGSSGTITKSGDSNSLGNVLLEEYPSAQQVRLPWREGEDLD